MAKAVITKGTQTFIWKTTPSDWKKLNCESAYEVEDLVNEKFFKAHKLNKIAGGAFMGSGYAFDIERSSDQVIEEFKKFLKKFKLTTIKIKEESPD